MDINEFAQVVLEQQRAELAARASQEQADAEHVEVFPGRKYAKVNVGTKWNGSVGAGKFMVDMETGEIFGIKGYGQVHKAHRYGTLDTVDQWYWGEYSPMRLADAPAKTLAIRVDNAPATDNVVPVSKTTDTNSEDEMTSTATAADITAGQIANALGGTEGNKTKAAAVLGISRSAFNRRVVALGGEVERIIAGRLARIGESDTATVEATGSTIKAEAADGSLTVIAETRRVDAGHTHKLGDLKFTHNHAGGDVAHSAVNHAEADATAPTVTPDAAPAPSGLVSPVRFYAILMDRGLAAGGLTDGNVYNWFRKSVMGFPVVHVTDDEVVHAAPVEVDGKRVSRPAVDLEAGLAWYAAYTNRAATRAAKRQAA